MGRVLDEITPAIQQLIETQHVFFVATAPSGSGGHVNLSPKGLDTFAVLGPREVAYLDLTGSGAETIAHLHDNGRITLMFCTFEGAPNIVRLYGQGEAIAVGDPRARDLRARFPEHPGARSVIRVDVERVSTSCGYAVPLMTYQDDRSRLTEWAEGKGPDGLVEYRADKNATSIDGLPALPVPID
ncbi:MAG: pyridoxamine 5'-phosphate oxidase family protein [Acidimicrobiia bacterium]|nr:pyridoxamine 5'-phosphate oxidase family protein [Acidimicrobiia bacterium]